MLSPTNVAPDYEFLLEEWMKVWMKERFDDSFDSRKFQPLKNGQQAERYVRLAQSSSSHHPRPFLLLTSFSRHSRLKLRKLSSPGCREQRCGQRDALQASNFKARRTLSTSLKLLR